MPETTFSIRSQSSNKIRIESTTIKADGGPVYPRLIVPANFDLHPVQSNNEEICFVILSIRCSLFLHAHPSKVADAIAIFNSYKISRHANSNFSFEFPFDNYRVRSIEEKRRGDAKIRLEFVFLVGLYQQNILVDFENPVAEIKFEIPKSQWIENILPALGLGEYFIIEIPYGKKTLQGAWSYLEKAEKSFWEWNIEGVYANCRELGAFLDESIKKQTSLSAFSISERWARAYNNFNHFSSLGLHLEDVKKSPKYSPGEIKISKVDVEHLLITSKALIKYAEELLRE